MPITENSSSDEGLNRALQNARNRLTRQTAEVKATIALIKLLEDTLTAPKGVSQHK